ncbi:MAG: ribonuclease H-like domain-containing protein [Dehalococcoidia bacterium]|nr:ribonuclease H-like domain-containing protein [Dehalococcoidia bacterium]
MKDCTDAYLDIETTGLSPRFHEITVAGIYLVCGGSGRLVQLVSRDITRDSLLEALEGVHTIHTYNGSRFDLPFIQCRLDIDLAGIFPHRDLMYDCWKRNLYGGYKAVECRLGIPRELKDVSGYEAVLLWNRYRRYGDGNALAKLLHYNREDVMNLKLLREMMDL